MKKYKIILLIITCLLFLTGCGSKIDPKEEPSLLKILQKSKLVDKEFTNIDRCETTSCSFAIDGCWAYETTQYYLYKDSSDNYLVIKYKEESTSKFLCVGKDSEHCLKRKNKYTAEIYEASKNISDDFDMNCPCNGMFLNESTMKKVEIKHSNFMFIDTSNAKEVKDDSKEIIIQV